MPHRERQGPKQVTPLESVQCLGAQSMGYLTKLQEADIDKIPHDHLSAAAAVEQVRATYAVATVLARIHEKLDEIWLAMPMAGKGY